MGRRHVSIHKSSNMHYLLFLAMAMAAMADSKRLELMEADSEPASVVGPAAIWARKKREADSEPASVVGPEVYWARKKREADSEPASVVGPAPNWARKKREADFEPASVVGPAAI